MGHKDLHLWPLVSPSNLLFFHAQAPALHSSHCGLLPVLQVSQIYSLLRVPALAKVGLRIFLLPQTGFSSHVSGLHSGEASFQKGPPSLTSSITKPCCIILITIITPWFMTFIYFYIYCSSPFLSHGSSMRKGLGIAITSSAPSTIFQA